MNNIVKGIRFDCCCEAVFEEVADRLVDHGFMCNFDTRCWIYIESDPVKMVVALKKVFEIFNDEHVSDIEYVEFVETAHKEDWTAVLYT